MNPEQLPPSEPQIDHPSGKPSLVATVGLTYFVLPLVIIAVLHFFVFQAFHVVGTSMVSTLHDTDYLIISKLGNTEAQIARDIGHQNSLYIPARGQIIVFHFPLDPSKIFVKRVVGVPGDRVVVKNGQVTIYNAANPGGFNPDAKYESAGTYTGIDTDVVVKPGNVFVMGDNRTDGGSYDSRQWGLLPSSYIVGNVVLRLLPLDQAKVF